MENDDELLDVQEFIVRSRAKMYRIARAELYDKNCENPEGHTEDVVNEVSISLFLHWEALRSKDDAMYVFTVNRARTHARTCRREVSSEITEGQAPLFPHPGLDPEQLLEQAEFVEWALSQLNESQQVVITMRLFLDMSFASIGERLGLPQGTVSATYSRALKKLRIAVLAQAAQDISASRAPAPEL